MRLKLFCLSILFIFLSVSCNLNNTHQVVYEFHNGQNRTYEQIQHNQKLSEPDTPTKEHYSFDGWYSSEYYTTKWDFSNNLVDSDIVLHAKWIPEKYLISFKTLEGVSVGEVYVEYGKFLEDIPIWHGYKCTGIYEDAEGTISFDRSQEIIENIVLYSIWEEADFHLPIIRINSEAPIIDKTNWINGTIDISNCSNSKHNLEEKSLEIKGRGNSSWGMPKKSYSIKLGKKENLFGIANNKHKNYALIAIMQISHLLEMNWHIIGETRSLMA